ncbi:sulfotransferase family 2 domain-containing protein [Alkalibacillus aidingensis]|uniref:sulfotransferase family 2 domain-containing protein n=1 Tax=Alkalibacillus aidingensis TaxID=2747607 RepID=UPI0016604B5C|nr:sulfotransferase family 2 domain-containing protein [Alkalibacillus aidingensis]
MIIFDQQTIDEKNPIVFVHIPKTGGQTMWDLLGRQKERIHVWHNKYFKVLNEPARYITILRDPVDRVISTYYYIRSYERDPLNHPVSQMSLERFVAYMKDDGIENKRFKRKEDVRNIRYRTVNLATRYLSGGDPNDIQKAKENIANHFTFIGFTDLYNESLSFMEKEFNWDFSMVKKRNTTKNRASLNNISQPLINTIKELNEHDLDLYHSTRTQFLDRLSY